VRAFHSFCWSDLGLNPVELGQSLVNQSATLPQQRRPGYSPVGREGDHRRFSETVSKVVRKRRPSPGIQGARMPYLDRRCGSQRCHLFRWRSMQVNETAHPQDREPPSCARHGVHLHDIDESIFWQPGMRTSCRNMECSQLSHHSVTRVSRPRPP
jgi:hypothetical protein